MADLIDDLRFALRMLRRDHGFAAITIIVLALGLAANTVIFSVIRYAILQPLQYDDSRRLVAIQLFISKVAGQYPMFPVSPLVYSAWSHHSKSLAAIDLVQEGVTLNLTGAGEPAMLNAYSVTPNLFALLGVRPQLGRSFLRDSNQSGKNHEVILTDTLWRDRLRGDRGIIGRSITLNSENYTVVGVLPPTFYFPEGNQLIPMIGPTAKAQLFVPLVLTNEQLASTGEFNFAAIARLRPGVGVAQATTELDGLVRGLPNERALYPHMRTAMMPLQDMTVRSYKREVWALFAAVFAVLLIICVNLTNLMLTRATARTHELAIRSAIGASRGRLLRQTLAETLLLGVLGGALGLVFAQWLLRVLVTAVPAGLPRLNDVRLDGAVLVFTLVVSILTGVLAGLLPAWRMAQSNPQDALYSGTARAGESGARLRARELLVGAQTTLSVILLTASGLLLLSFAKLQNVPKGFAVQHILTVNLNLSPTEYTRSQQRDDFWHKLVTATAALPSMGSSAITNVAPLSGTYDYDVITAPGDTRPIAEQPWANYRRVSPGYFRTLGIPLLSGRDLTWADAALGNVVISSATAKALWHGRNPIGRRFGEGVPFGFQVVGLAGDTRGITLSEGPGPMVYRVYDGSDDNGLQAQLLLRTGLPETVVAQQLRQTIWKLDSSIPVPEIKSMTEILSDSLAPWRFETLLMSTFAAAALLLACLGIYGVVSYSVVRRTSEIGVRIALGASPSKIYRMILVRGLRPVVWGLVAGIGGTLALAQVLAHFLFEVQPYDPAMLAIVAGTLLTAAAIASALPALRASRIAPSEAIRTE
jgi:predicted permease